MKSKVVWALVALNVALSVCLAAQWLRPNMATAQVAQAPRPSDYIVIPGSVQGNPAQVLYIIDTQNGWLGARTFSGQTIVDGPPLNLNRLFNPQAPKKAGRGL
jgi:hypothetical protein